MTSWLHEQRLETVLGVIRETQARTVLDLGCGEGDLLIRLVQEPYTERVVGIDLSHEALDRLRMRLSDMPEVSRQRVELVYGSMTESGSKLEAFDAAVLVETIEHLEPRHLSKLEQAVFGSKRAATVVITTPNADFNPLLGVPLGRFRHPDHRFEWGRAKFRSWADGVARRNGYSVRCFDVAGMHPQYGGATQMGRFTREMKARTHPAGSAAPFS